MSDAKPDAVSGVPYLVTLVATETVSDAMLRRASETCMDHGGAEIASSRGDERMATIRATMIDCDGLTAALEAVLPDVDVIVRPADMRPRLFVADMDSTMITVECIDELADFAGLKAEVSAVTEAAMRGELDFEAALRERVALLAGLEERAIAACLDQRVRSTAGAASLLRALRSSGVRCVLVSGGFTAFAEPVGNMLGFDRVVANVLEISDGVLTGRLAGPVVDGMTKRHVLEEELASLAVSAGHAIAIGDGANDLHMVKAAGLGVAYHAKPALAEKADARIRHGDLTVLERALSAA